MLQNSLRKLLSKSDSSDQINKSSNELLIECSIEPVQKQNDLVMCGLFSIAFAFDLCQGIDPNMRKYDISKMREHLLLCLKNNYFEGFPQLKDYEPHVSRVSNQIIFIELI